MNLHLLVTSTNERRRGASRPTIVIGFASIGGLVAMIAAAILGLTVLGMGLPDDAAFLPFVMMVGAGAGWLIGVALGSVAADGARPPGGTGRTLLLLAAVAVALGALALVLSPMSSGWLHGGVTLFSVWRERGGPAFEVVLIADTIVVLITFLVVGRRRETAASSRPPGRIVGAIGLVGLVVGVVSFSLGMTPVPLRWSTIADHQRYRAVTGTVASLMTAAEEQQRRTGSYPTSIEEVLAAGARVHRGTQVEFAGIVNEAFCVRVGIDVGDDDRAGEPHYSGLAHPQPPKARSWLSEEAWAGNSCSPGE